MVPDEVYEESDEESGFILREILPFTFAQGRYFVQNDSTFSLVSFMTEQRDPRCGDTQKGFNAHQNVSRGWFL